MKLIVGQEYKVKAVQLLPVGVVVTMEDNTTELIHISNIANCFVSNVGDFVTLEQEYVATCREGKSKPIELTLLPLHLESRKPRASKQRENSDAVLDAADSDHSNNSRYLDKRNRRG